MSYEKLNPFPGPEKIVIKDTDGDTRVPYQRVAAYDDKEFELFIREWVVSLRDRFEVRGFGGAGDKGRDVIARDEMGNFYYYQCKHYDHALMPSDIIPEFGKLVYYTFLGEIPIPKEYYILAPKDIGPKLNDLICNPMKINDQLITEWNTSCRTKIKSTPVDLTGDLEEYIRKFDFSIIKTKTMLEVVEEHRNTAFYAFRFGGGLTIRRDRSVKVPDIAEKIENMYIQKMLAAISEKENCNIATLEQLFQQFPSYTSWIKKQRERFFSADNLRVFAQRHLLADDYFQELVDDIYDGIFDFFEKAYDSGYDRLLDVMTNVVQIDLQHNLLSKYDLVHPKDRQGICHYLANERTDVIWTNKK